MGIINRLLRREGEAALVRRDGRALLCFLYNGGRMPFARVVERWPELAPLAPLVPDPERLETPLPPEQLPAAIEAVVALAEACRDVPRLRFTISEALLAPEAEEAPPVREEPPAPAPSRPAGESFFRDAAALMDREEADARPVPLEDAYPTYESLSPEQLKWYLYLRGRLRRGEYPDTPYAYLLLYIYELVNRLGVEDAGQGLDALVGLWQHYRGRCPALAGSPARWIWDYRQAYGVDRSPEALLWALPGLPAMVSDALLTAMDDAGLPLRLPLWMLSELSGYDVGRSPFFQKSEDQKALAGQFSDAVAAVDAALRRTEGAGLLSGRSLARLRAQEVAAFRGAPVRAERRYVLRLRRLHGSPRLTAWLKPLLRYIENGLRARYRFPGRLKGAEADELSRAAVDTYLAGLDAKGDGQEAPRPAPKLSLDMGSVARLRAESDAVRDALLAAVAADASEEAEDGPILWEDPEPVAEGAAPVVPEEESPVPQPSSPWDAFMASADREALAALLEGPEQLRLLARARGRMPDALLDAINEAAAGTVGDLVADGDGVFEEYKEIIEKML